MLIIYIQKRFKELIMKVKTLAPLILMSLIAITACYGQNEGNRRNQMKLKIGNRTLTATLADNSTAEALLNALAEGPMTIDMRDYGNMEKVGSFGMNLPRNDEQISTEAGDLILYQGSAFVIYYDTNAWNFTRIGKIDNITQKELKEILGRGNVTVTLMTDGEK